MTDIDRDEYGGPVNSDVSYFRGSGGIVDYPLVDSTCHRCVSSEVYQPMQTMDMPMVLRCLRCGLVAPTGDFHGGGG